MQNSSKTTVLNALDIHIYFVSREIKCQQPSTIIQWIQF